MMTTFRCRMIAALGLGLLGGLPLQAYETNRWTNAGNGYWDTIGNWSAGAPSSNDWVLITNAGSKTVTIDSVTSGSSPETMSIGKLLVGAPLGSTNTLVLTNPGTNVPLSVSGSAWIRDEGSLRISNGAVRVGGDLEVDGDLSLVHPNAQLIATNSTTTVNSYGTLSQSAGTMTLESVYLGGFWLGGTNLVGTMSLSGGKSLFRGNLHLGYNTNAVGVLSISGGELVTTNANGPAYVGHKGTGTVVLSSGAWRAGDVSFAFTRGAVGSLLMDGGELSSINVVLGEYGVGVAVVSNGTWSAGDLRVGNGSRSIFYELDNRAIGQGGLTVAGGAVEVGGVFRVGGYVFDYDRYDILGPSTGAVLVTGGQLVTTNNWAYLSGGATLTVSGGVWRAQDVRLGGDAGEARLNVAGGTNLIAGRLKVGVPDDNSGWWDDVNATGHLAVVQGQLVVTNSGGDGLLNLQLGSMTVAGGSVVLDRLVRTNLDWGGMAKAALSFNAGDVLLRSSRIAGSADSSAVCVGAEGRRAVLLLTGGTNTWTSPLFLGAGSGATGEVILATGVWDGYGVSTVVGSNGTGRVTTSNGVWYSMAPIVGAGAGGRGTLVLVSGTNDFSYGVEVGVGVGATGSVVVSGGSLLLSDWFSATNVIGAGGVGQLTISNGTVALGKLRLADGDQGRGTLTLVGGDTTANSLVATNSRATVTFAGGTLVISNMSVIDNGSALSVGSAGRQANLLLTGTNRFEDGLIIAGAANATGAVVVASGQLWVTNGSLHVGDTGVGSLTVSNGTLYGDIMRVGANAGSLGTVLLAGGTNSLDSSLTVGLNAGATGRVVVTGGRFIITNGLAYIGNSGVGSLAVSNGAWLAEGVRLGASSGSHGTLTLAGGTNLVSSNLWVGYAAGATGSVLISGGTLAVTNAAGSGLVDVRRGTLAINGGTLFADNLLATNSAGQVQFSDGEIRPRSSLVDNGARLSLGAAGGEAILRLLSGTHRFEDGLDLAGVANSTGTVWLSSGSLLVTNNNTYIGLSGVGRMTVSNGVWNARDVTVGRNEGSSGSVILLGGTNSFSSYLSLGSLEQSTGVVLVAGARLVVTNNATYVGNLGVGGMTVSNGTWLAREVSVGHQGGAGGALLVAGGTSLLASNLWVGNAAGATGSVLVTGGELVTTNQGVFLGNSGVGAATFSGGTWRVASLLLGQNSGSAGSLTVANGSLAVTNATGGGMLEVRRGSLAVSGGSLELDYLLATNSAGSIQFGDGDLVLHGSRVANGVGMFLGASLGQATLRLVEGTNRVDTGLTLGNVANSTGTVWLTGGDLLTTNASVYIGMWGVGQMTVSNGTWRGKDVTLGDQAGSRGTLTLLGGTNDFGVQLSLGDAMNTTGTLALKGGMLVTTNGSTAVGVSGRGDMTVSNGVWLGNTLSVGMNSGARGTLTIAGGTNQIGSFFTVGSAAGSTGLVVVAGGRLETSNSTTWVGASGVGGLAVSNGTWLAKDVWVGNSVGSRGTLTLDGGTNQIFSTLGVGNNAGATGTVLLTGGSLVATNWGTALGVSGRGEMTVSGGVLQAASVLLGQNSGAVGMLTVAGGSLVITNATGDGEVELRRGSLLVNGGTLVADSLLATNSTGQVQYDEGTLELRSANVDDGSGLVALGAAGGRMTLRLGDGVSIFRDELRLGREANSTGSVWLARGTLLATNASVDIGWVGVGEMTVSNGTFLARNVNLGSYSAGARGTLTLLGGTNVLSSSLTLGSQAGATGTVVMSGGLLVVTNNSLKIGDEGVGQMTVSGGRWLAKDVHVGFQGGSSGTLLLTGGTNLFGSMLMAGNGAGATGTVVLAGGVLVVTNNFTDVGNDGVGTMTVSNGMWSANGVVVGNGTGARGTLLLVGGTNRFSSGFEIGSSAGATGTVVLSGGELLTTNAATTFGYSGWGRLTVSGGAWRASSILLGQNSGATGMLSVAGGLVLVTNAAQSGVLELRRGSFALNGGTTVLDRLLATNAAGSFDFNGGTLSSRGTVVSNGAVFSVGDGAASAALNLLGGTHAFQNGVAVTPNAAVSGWGSVVGALANTGSVMTAGGELRLLGSVQGPGSWLAASGNTLSFVRGGTVDGFASTGATVRVEGSLTNTGAISNPNGLILVGPDGSNGLLNVTGGSVDGGILVVGASGALKVAAAVDTMSSFVTNQGSFQPLADFFTLSGGFRNEAAFTSRNAQVVNVLNGFGNTGSVVLETNSMLRVNGFGGQPQSGQISLRSGAILQSLALWTNSGTITVAKGSMIAGASMQNQSLMDGAGYVSAALGNRSGGTVRASNGVLTLGGVVTNFAGGTLAALASSELALNNDLVNQGTVAPQGGSINLPYLTLTNSGTLSGYGTYRAASIVNGGLASFSGGRVDIEAVYNNLGGKTTRVTSATARFFGAVSNQAGGVFKNTSGNFTFYDTFYNAGLYASDPATNVFEGDLVIGEGGAISGGAGDVFQLGEDLTVLNSNGLDLAGATLQFDTGAHTLSLAGTPQIGTLALDAGAHLWILGADLYVDTLSFSTAQITTAQSIFYDQASNPSLGGQTLTLTGGGSLIAVPEPGGLSLLLAALALAAGFRRRCAV